MRLSALSGDNLIMLLRVVDFSVRLSSNLEVLLRRVWLLSCFC